MGMNKRERIHREFEKLVSEYGLDGDRASSYLVDECVRREGLRVIRAIRRDRIKLELLRAGDEVVGRDAEGREIEGAVAGGETYDDIVQDADEGGVELRGDEAAKA